MLCLGPDSIVSRCTARTGISPTSSCRMCRTSGRQSTARVLRVAEGDESYYQGGWGLSGLNPWSRFQSASALLAVWYSPCKHETEPSCLAYVTSRTFSRTSPATPSARSGAPQAVHERGRVSTGILQ